MGNVTGSRRDTRRDGAKPRGTITNADGDFSVAGNWNPSSVPSGVAVIANDPALTDRLTDGFIIVSRANSTWARVREFAFCGRPLKEPLGRTGLPVVLSAVALAKEEAFLAFVASAK
jgi:hypothetical protein